MHAPQPAIYACRRLLCVGLATLLTVCPCIAQHLEMLPEASTPDMRRFAVFFDFDLDSCYPSSAISPGLVVNSGLSVNSYDPSYVEGCRDEEQLTKANTYHRRAAITQNGNTYAVHMYALYFMKDKDLPAHQAEGVLGHRHDWEFAMIWTTNNAMTHAYVSQHSGGELQPISALYFDAWCPECVKVVYDKHGGLTHRMRFANKNEKAENHTRYWIKPPIVDWWRMSAALRSKLNAANFGQADCSVCDARFKYAISADPPAGYPNGDAWKEAAEKVPVGVERLMEEVPPQPPPDIKSRVRP